MTYTTLQFVDGSYGMDFVFTIKQIIHSVKNTTILCNYWYPLMTTCFGISLDQLQANVLKLEVPFRFPDRRQ
jgi:hypothetical protein